MYAHIRKLRLDLNIITVYMYISTHAQTIFCLFFSVVASGVACAGDFMQRQDKMKLCLMFH